MMDNKWFFQTKIFEDANMNLFLFPYAGGNATSYVKWKRYLSGQYSMYPILYPGRGKRVNEMFAESVVEMARFFVDDNSELFETPFVLFGHCTGAVIAFEVCKYLENKYGKNPMGLIISCGASPDIPIFEVDAKKLSDEEFLQLLIDTNRMDQSTAQLANFREYYLPIIKKDFIMAQNYACDTETKIDCPIDTIIALDDEMITAEQIRGWKKYTNGRVRSREVTGGHYYFEKYPEMAVQIVDEILKTYQLGV